MPIKFSELTTKGIANTTKIIGLYTDNTTTTGSGNCLINVSDFAKASALNNLDSSALHKSGNESITGVKTFNAVAVFNGDNTFNGINTFTTSSNSGISLKLKSTTIDKTVNPSEKKYIYTNYLDKNNERIGVIGARMHTDGYYGTYLQAGNEASIWVLSNGTNVSTSAPTPASDSNDNNIATTNWIRTLLKAMYPVGSIYIGTNTTCPMATIIPGSTWTLVAANKALWTGSGNNGNTTIEAGLPNITGSVVNGGADDEGPLSGSSAGSGCFSVSKTGKNGASGSASAGGYNFAFNASNSNPIYGKSTTVQPPAYVVNVWRRTA